MNSRKVYRALATNTSIVPRGPYLSALARSAQMDHQVAWSLAARDDFDAALLAPAFFDLNETDRIKVIAAFARRATPDAPIKRTLEQLSVATAELTRALMKLFSENRRPEVTRLLHQITGLDEVRCGQIAHDNSGAALFVVLRAFGCNVQDGLKVLIHATSHDEDRSKALAHVLGNVRDCQRRCHGLPDERLARRGEPPRHDQARIQAVRGRSPPHPRAADARAQSQSSTRPSRLLPASGLVRAEFVSRERPANPGRLGELPVRSPRSPGRSRPLAPAGR